MRFDARKINKNTANQLLPTVNYFL